MYPANIFKIPTVVGILTFMGRINIKLSWVEHGKTVLQPRGLIKSLYECGIIHVMHMLSIGLLTPEMKFTFVLLQTKLSM